MSLSAEDSTGHLWGLSDRTPTWENIQPGDKAMRKSLVSLVALGLFLGAPAFAGSAEKSTSTEATSTQQQATSTQQQGTSLDAAQFEQLLAGYEAKTEIQGQLARAITSDGEPIMVFVAPEGAEAGASVAAQDSDIRDRFEQAGFTGVEVLGEPHIARADLDEDHYIYAIPADQLMRPGTQSSGVSGEIGSQAGVGEPDDATREPGTEGALSSETQTGSTTGELGTGEADSGTTAGQSGTTTGEADIQAETETDTQLGQAETETDTQMGEAETETDTQLGQAEPETGTQLGQAETEMDSEADAGQIGRALGAPDADRIVSAVEEAGIEDASEFQGRLVRARTEEGAPVFFMITPKDMEAATAVDISEDEVRQKLEEAKLQDVQFMEEAMILRGSLEDDNVFVMAGLGMGQGTQQ
jgi:hypothetical protein